jgi:hypothetical protein
MWHCATHPVDLRGFPESPPQSKGLKTDFKNQGFSRMAYNPERQVCIYVIEEAGSPEVCKIGITELLARRLGSMQSSNWRKLTIVAAFPVESWELAQGVEAALLARFRYKIVRGEWIGITPVRLEAAIDSHLKSIDVPALNVIKDENSNVIKIWANQ